MKLTIDSEFRTLIPPLTADEFSQLEANCLENGIQDSLKTWDGILIDGHNRYEIAEKHGLEYKTEEMEFSSRDDVKLWIIKNQLGRRNLSTYDRSVLALKLKPVIAEMAKKNVLATQKNESASAYQKSDKQIVTNKEVGRIAEVSHDTIHKVDVIENSGNEDIKNKVRNKKISIDKAYREVKGLPPKRKSQPQTEVRNVEITVTNEDVMKNPVQVEERKVEEEPLPFEEKVEFIETDESHEEVDDVAKDVAETAGLLYADEILSGITKIVNTVKYNRANVVDEISKLNCDGFSRDEFLASVDECMKMLAKLQNGLNGFTVRTE